MKPKKWKTIIVDDEPVALDILENYIQRLDMLQLLGRFTISTEAFQYLQTQQIDLLFLDINMPNLNGIELLSSLSKAPKVIFTTAYEKYALLGYELNIVDYLLKPIAFPRFLKAVNKIALAETLPTKDIDSEWIKEAPHIFIPVDKKMRKVHLENVLFLESIGNYVKIHSKNEILITYSSLTYMEEKLPNDQFIRIHRSYIIALSHLNSYSTTQVEVAGQSLPLSRSYKVLFLKKVGSS